MKNTYNWNIIVTRDPDIPIPDENYGRFGDPNAKPDGENKDLEL